MSTVLDTTASAPVQRVLERLESVRRNGDGWQARCPAHDDRNPSLSISVGEGERALLHCHAGCSTDDVVAALELRLGDLFPDDDTSRNGDGYHGNQTAEYDYVDEAGKLLFQVVRQPGKKFLQRRPDPDSEDGWRWGLSDKDTDDYRQRYPKPMPPARRVLYRLPAVAEAVEQGRFIFDVEGEKDVHSLERLGITATCNPGGARKWRSEYSSTLRGARVVVCGDRDEPGERHAQDVAESLQGIAQEVRLLDLDPAGSEGYDVSDFLADVRSPEDVASATLVLREAVRNSPTLGSASSAAIEPPQATKAPELEPQGNREGAFGRRGGLHRNDWPKQAADDAYIGLAGEIVHAIEPHSEADPVALLAQLLVALGNACSRGPGFQAEGDFHATNLNLAIVGETSKGRKGTSWGRIRQLFAQVDEDWVRHRIVGGLSSGEGLVWQVRDPIVRQVAIKEGNPPKPTGDYREEMEDAGIDDKRLLVQEGELAQGLRAMRREGNTLSPVIRNLWDHGSVASLTKNSPARTTGALVSIIGHITRDELRRELTATDAANGFANRFLFVCARRSKYLPDGGTLRDVDLEPFARQLADVVDFARRIGTVERDPQARELWHRVYPTLSKGRPGLLGAVTSRAEAQTMRLAVLYALLDRSPLVRVDHLRAALALWDYCFASAAHIFGNSLGDPVADEILSALRASDDGLTRTEIRDLFNRHQNRERIDLALSALERSRFASPESVATGGRPVERWRCDQSIPRDKRP